MARSLTLIAQARTETGRHVKAIRRQGQVPAVVYGHGQKPVSIAAEERALERLWITAGRTHLVELRIEGHRMRKVLIRELQHNPRSGRIQHADFFAVNLREKLIADVPIVVVGEAPAVVDTKVGQLLQTLSTIKVECLPDDIPGQLSVDVSGLTEVEQQITLGEIEIPAGVTLVHADLEETVVKIAQLRVREEEEELETEDAAAAGEDAGVEEGGDHADSA